MRKNTLIQTLAIGLSALFLGLSSVQAADAGVVQLIGPDSTVRSFQIDTRPRGAVRQPHPGTQGQHGRGQTAEKPEGHQGHAQEQQQRHRVTGTA